MLRNYIKTGLHVSQSSVLKSNSSNHVHQQPPPTHPTCKHFLTLLASLSYLCVCTTLRLLNRSV